MGRPNFDLAQVDYEGPYLVSAGTDGNKLFGSMLSEFKDVYDLSSIELADRAGVHASFVRGIERGVQAPSRETAKKLFDAFNLDVRHSLEWVDEKVGFDVLIPDIDRGVFVAFQFKAKLQGQNRRPEVERMNRLDLRKAAILTTAQRIRLDCLELAMLDMTLSTSDLVERAESFYRFVKGESDEES